MEALNVNFPPLTLHSHRLPYVRSSFRLSRVPAIISQAPNPVNLLNSFQFDWCLKVVELRRYAQNRMQVRKNRGWRSTSICMSPPQIRPPAETVHNFRIDEEVEATSQTGGTTHYRTG